MASPETIADVNEKMDLMIKTFEQGREEIDPKIKKAVDAQSAEVKEMMDKVSEDMCAKQEALEESQKKLNAAMNRQKFENIEHSKKQILHKEGQAIKKWMKGVVGTPGAEKQLNDILGEELLNESKGLSVGDDTQAGFAVKPQIEAMLDATIVEQSIFRQLARTVNLTQSDSMERLKNQKGGVGATRDGETESATNDDTGNPTVSLDDIHAHFMGAAVPVTQQLLDDAGFDMAAWVQREANEDFSSREDTEYFTGRIGTGAGASKEARGILTYDAGTSYGQIEQVNSGASGAFDGDTVLALFGSMKERYLGGSVCFANRLTIWKNLFSLKDDAGNYILARDFSSGPNFRLLGAPIHAAPAMPVAAANSLSLALINVGIAYTVVNRQGMAVLRDPYTIYPKVNFRFRKRTGGDVEIFEAIKLQKLAV
jgi:HK97 family phage major capsid protein